MQTLYIIQIIMTLLMLMHSLKTITQTTIQNKFTRQIFNSKH